MRAYIVSGGANEDDAAIFSTLLQHWGHTATVVASLSEVPRKVSNVTPRTFVILPSRDELLGVVDQAVTFLEVRPDVFVLYVADAVSAENYKRLIKTGRGEWLQWDRLEAELPDVLVKADLSSVGVAQTGKVISLLPSKGGVGNTTLAVELGLLLGAGKTRLGRLAIVDLNFQGSTLADALDVEPRLNVSEFLSRPERLDDQLLEIFASRHASGVDVFAAPPVLMDLALIGIEALLSLLDGLSRRYQVVVVDLPHQWFPWVDNVLRGSDVTILIGGSTVPAVRQLAPRVQHLDGLGIPPERMGIVINQCGTNAFGRVQPTPDIDRAFIGRKLFHIACDVRTASEASNTGRSMNDIAPRRPVMRSIRQIAEWVKSII